MQCHAFPAQGFVISRPRNLEQIGGGGQRCVGVAHRQLDLINQIGQLPAQFRFEGLGIHGCERRRCAAKILLRECRLRQQQAPAGDQFIRRVQLRRALKHAIGFLQQRPHLRPMAITQFSARRRRLDQRPEPQG